MSDWISYLKEDPTEWLLKPDNPSVRYLTLTEILGKPVSDPQVKKTRNEIMKWFVAQLSTLADELQPFIELKH